MSTLNKLNRLIGYGRRNSLHSLQSANLSLLPLIDKEIKIGKRNRYTNKTE